MNAKVLFLALAVVLMTAVESSNTFAKRDVHRKQEGVSDEELEDFLENLVALEDLVNELEATFGNRSPAKRALRKRKVDDDFDITDENLED